MRDKILTGFSPSAFVTMENLGKKKIVEQFLDDIHLLLISKGYKTLLDKENNTIYIKEE